MKALSVLGTSLAQVQQWEQAAQVWTQAQLDINIILRSYQRAERFTNAMMRVTRTDKYESKGYELAEALRVLGTALVQAQQWERAERVINTIQNGSQRAEALTELSTALAQAQQWDQAAQAWTEAERVINTIQNSVLGTKRAEALKKLGTALAQAQQWERAEHVIDSIQDNLLRGEALSALGTALAQAQQWDQAAQAWTEAERVINTIQNSPLRIININHYNFRREEALRTLVTALIQAQQWERAERFISTIENSSLQAGALRDLATAMANADEFDQLLHLIQRAWRQVETREEALTLFSLASAFISRKPAVGIAFFEAFTWVDTFLSG